MSRSCDEALQANAKVMQNNILYHLEYREVFVTLLRNFKEPLQTMSCLCDIVEAVHVYLRMMEQYCRTNRHMVVQERGKKGGGRRRGGGKKGRNLSVLTEDQLIDEWEIMDARFSSSLPLPLSYLSLNLLSPSYRVLELIDGTSGEALPPTPPPFDPVSALPLEEQRIAAMGRIRQYLIDARHPDAVTHLRVARSAWPESVFGAEGMSADEELEAIRGVFFDPASG